MQLGFAAIIAAGAALWDILSRRSCRNRNGFFPDSSSPFISLSFSLAISDKLVAVAILWLCRFLEYLKLEASELSDLGSWSDKLRYESETANSYPGK